MKKLVLSALTVLATGAMAIGATRAVFSDTAAFTGNTISTATVNISALSEPKGLLPKPLQVTGLTPGEWTDWARGVVYNEANSTDVKVFMHIANASGAACNSVNLEVYTGHADDGDPSEREFVIYDGALLSFDSGNRQEVTGHTGLFDPTIAPNTSAVIQQRAELDVNAPNGIQGTDCTWDEVFTAETVAPTP